MKIKSELFKLKTGKTYQVKPGLGKKHFNYQKRIRDYKNKRIARFNRKLGV